MGSSQSIPSTSEITDAPAHVSHVKEYTASTKNGPKTKSALISATTDKEEQQSSASSVVSAESDYSSDEDFDFDSNEEEDGKCSAVPYLPDRLLPDDDAITTYPKRVTIHSISFIICSLTSCPIIGCNCCLLLHYCTILY